MIDHITLRTRDIEATKAFYTHVLPTIGYDRENIHDQVDDEVRVIGFARDEKYDTWFTTDLGASWPIHIAWRAQSREEVDAFYRAALEAGGKDNWAPGVRAHYHPNYYGAFVFDPDGHNIEAVCHNHI